MVVNVIIIDAQGSFEYTTEGYTFEFDETSTVDVFDRVKCLLVAKILSRDRLNATCYLDADRSRCLC